MAATATNTPSTPSSLKHTTTVFCDLKSNGSPGCGSVMVEGRHYSGADCDEYSDSLIVSYRCPNCGNYIDSRILENRKSQMRPKLVWSCEKPISTARERMERFLAHEEGDDVMSTDAQEQVAV